MMHGGRVVIYSQVTASGAAEMDSSVKKGWVSLFYRCKGVSYKESGAMMGGVINS